MPSALRVSRLGGGWSSIFKVARGEEARSLIAHHVSLLDGRLRSSRQYCGPRLWMPSALRDLAAGRRLVLDLQSCEGRGGEEPNRAPRVPSDGRLRSSRQYCGPKPWMPSALRVSRLGGGWSSIFRVARGEEARSLIAHHVSL
jgi:hypothetical protein